MKFILFLILCILGVAVYQVAVEEGYFDSGSASGDYASEAAVRPSYDSVPPGEPYVGPYTSSPIDCNDLATLKRNMNDAYRTFQAQQNQANYENYVYHKRRLDDAISQCYR